VQRQIQTIALVACAYATGSTTVVADEAVMDDKQVGIFITWCVTESRAYEQGHGAKRLNFDQR
jgi:hypothetical protein